MKNGKLRNCNASVSYVWDCEKMCYNHNIFILTSYTSKVVEVNFETLTITFGKYHAYSPTTHSHIRKFFEDLYGDYGYDCFLYLQNAKGNGNFGRYEAIKQGFCCGWKVIFDESWH